MMKREYAGIILTEKKREKQIAIGVIGVIGEKMTKNRN